MTSRRYFLVSAAALLLSRLAEARPGRVWRIGYLAPGMPDDAQLLKASLEGLGLLGYTEDRDIVIEHRIAEGRFEALPVLTANRLQRSRQAESNANPWPLTKG